MVFDKVSRESLMLTSTHPSGDIEVVSVSIDPEVSKSSVTLRRGAEVAELRYDPALLERDPPAPQEVTASGVMPAPQFGNAASEACTPGLPGSKTLMPDDETISENAEARFARSEEAPFTPASKNDEAPSQAN